LFTLFGLDGVRLRIDDCAPRLLLTNAEKAHELSAALDIPLVVAGDALTHELGRYPETFEPCTSADDMAIYQYTSGTTRELPAAVRHTHRAIVTLMVAALYGTGIRPGERWRQKLQQANARCEAVICLLSKHWEASRECQTEFRYAENLNKTILCARLGGR